MNRTVLQSCGCCQKEPSSQSSADGISANAAAVPATKGKRGFFLALGGIAAIAAEATSLSVGDHHPLVIVLSLLAIAIGALDTYRKGWLALKSFDMNMNALMTIGATGAMMINRWPEAAMVMVLFSLSEEIEIWSLTRAKRSIRDLMAKAPDTAHVRTESGCYADLDTSEVKLGAVVWIKPGERIPLDGTILSGRSTVNQAPITGESSPSEKNPGDQVFAGTINENGSFEYEVTSLAADSQLARIIVLVEQAQGKRALTQRFVDKFARVYTPAVMIMSLFVAIVPPLAFSLPFFDWFYRALVLLVIACPCALVISTPVTIVSGLAAAARQGILVKGGAILELGRKIKTIAFDKTGTITSGKLEVTKILLLSDENSESESSHHWLAASLAHGSDHPVCLAILSAWDAMGHERPLASFGEFENMGGRGIKARIDGQWYFLGSLRLVQELGLCSDQHAKTFTDLEKSGKTITLLISDKNLICLFALEDSIKKTSRQAIDEIRELGIRTVILSGDNEHVVQEVGKIVGIDHARSNLLPEEKLSLVNGLAERRGTIAMVGDGINDAPALARASIGFAMGVSGTDTAIETADVAIMNDDLRKIPQFIRLSRAANRILIQNFSFAIGIKIIFLALAISGTATLWMAVFADVGASLLVTFNGLRLLMYFKNRLA